MRCRNCGANVEANQSFCQCGEPVTARSVEPGEGDDRVVDRAAGRLAPDDPALRFDGKEPAGPRLLMTTTPWLEGQPVKQYLGVVTGESIVGINLFRDFLAGLRDIVGGRSKSYEKEARLARDTALDELSEAARKLGATAVIGVSLDVEPIHLKDGGGMLMVCASGTAVKV